MAQVYIPESVQEREQLQGGSSTPRQNRPPREEPRKRLGFIDLGIALVLIATVSLIIVAASRWTAPLNPAIQINLSPTVLPVYAGYSFLRMLLAYILSLIFTFIYGHIAATNKRANTVMVPLLDILQSIPILSFLPGVVLALVGLFPHANIGLELASVVLIFTSQAWNMTFSYYHSARTLPKDLKEFSSIARLRPWQRFFKLEVPASMIGLIWNSMMSWAGGWFFLMASEQLVLGSRSFQLPGLGSYLQTAANKGNALALILGLITLIALIILMDFFFWRPLVAWADRFKLEMNSEGDAPTSPVLNILRRSALVGALNQRLFRPIGSVIAGILNRLQPLQVATGLASTDKEGQRRFTVGGLLKIVLLAALLVGVLAGLWFMLLLLRNVSFAMWGQLVLAAGATFLRTLIALLVGLAWTIPVGVAIGLSPKWSRRLQPVVQVVASIPATALFPILLVALVGLPGGLSLAAILLMLLGTQWYMLFNIIAGAMSIPSDLKEATTIYHVTRWRRWRTLILPAIFPYLVTGMLTASGGAWNASVVSEYVTFNGKTVSTFGLGSVIAASGADGNFSLLLAGTLLMAAVVILINRLLWKRLYGLTERRYTLG
ncbi:ABC transporter permease [Dictyobacter aurantiacus]|uniref:ABC transporter permease n=1 Tax=Dictyobacter aurantiacus TaxID=1936993 RepID=A0A401ZSA0_9CHLR|nr:ABC transporter permease subunit [Dictyobacter aurantiacus]GCE09745.1 ABC transporter permease [Dictyobacter aurantiacus]